MLLIMTIFILSMLMNLTKFPILKSAMQKAAITTAKPAKYRWQAEEDTVCVALFTSQVAYATLDTARYTAGEHTADCRSLFFYNPETKAAVGMHLHNRSDITSIPEAMRWAAGKSKKLDLYVYGGMSRCDFHTDKEYQKILEDDENGIECEGSQKITAANLEKTLKLIEKTARELGIEINYRVINIFDQKPEDNAVLDLSNGEFFFVQFFREHILRLGSEPDYSKPGPLPLHRVFG
jgi:hypothetical protein